MAKEKHVGQVWVFNDGLIVLRLSCNCGHSRTVFQSLEAQLVSYPEFGIILWNKILLHGTLTLNDDLLHILNLLF
jgi:hypothetical protein